ncbi:MAG TPA: ABC transporter permease [Thermoanaerobaculia bacterium]|jgi:predicted permease
MGAFRNDLRYAVRTLWRSRGFTAVAVATLALGIGANTALFGWIRALLLDPLPGVPHANEIVAVETRTPAGTRIDSSWADYSDLAREARSFSGLVAFQQRHVTLQEGERARRLYALFVSGNYFDVLGVRPELGRTFLPDEGRVPGGAPVAVIGYGFWRQHFRADPKVVGRAVRINDQPLTVVGVLPRDFKGTINGLNFEVYVPVAAAGRIGGEVGGSRALLEGNRTTRWLAMMGRLAPGSNLRRAQAELATAGARLAAAYADSNRGIGFVAEPIDAATYGASSRFGTVIVALFAAVGLALLVACANVASLLLVRATARRGEIALRVALGATRARLMRQLVTESLVLSFAGGAVGLLLVPQVNALIAGIFPAGIPLPLDLDPPFDAVLFAFAFGLSALTGLIFGIAPALHASRPEIRAALNEASAGAGAGTSGPRQRLRRVLVAAQLALAVILLAVTGLFLASLRNAAKIDPGFDASGVLLVGFDFPASLDRAAAVPFYRSLRDRVARIPGVVAASYGNHPPLWIEGGDWEEIGVDGYTPGPDENMKIDVTLTWPGYFALMRIPLDRGRDFDEHDDANSAPVAIVNEAFAGRYLKGRSAVGAKLRIGGDETVVIGLVRTAKYRTLTEAPRPFVYLPQLQILPSGTALHVRTAPGMATAPLLARIRSEVAALDPRVATLGVRLSDATKTAVLPQSLGARFLGALGALVLAISAIGVYGVAAYSVSRRRREIGIRVALGARPAEVRRMFVREGMRLTAAGLVAGLAGAAALTRFLGGLLIDVRPGDPAVFAGAAFLLGGAALLASWLPARRAATLDPAEALRSD